MTTEQATMILRRKPQDDHERAACHAALEVLGRAGVPIYEIEGDIMRHLTDRELEVLVLAH